MEQLRIDPEFKGKIPPLTEAEYHQLEENILEAGEVYEPIVVWNGVIVDGHNRYRIIQEHPEVRWKTREMHFENKWAAFNWMYKNQLGRRNLTESQKTYLIGKLYEARKHSHGGHLPGSAQNGHSIRTAERIAKEIGVSKNTVKRAEKYANGIDAIREENPSIADAILTGKLTPDKQDVRSVGQAKEEDRTKMIQRIKEGKQVSDQINRITKSIEDMKNTDDTSPYSVEDLVNEIKWNAELYMSTIRGIIEQHKQVVTDENRELIEDALDNYIIDAIEMIKEGLVYGTDQQ